MPRAAHEQFNGWFRTSLAFRKGTTLVVPNQPHFAGASAPEVSVWPSAAKAVLYGVQYGMAKAMPLRRAAVIFGTASKGISGRLPTLALFLLLHFVLGTSALAQQAGQQMPDLSKTDSFPNVLSPYRSKKLPSPDFNNARVAELIRDGKLQLSIKDLTTAVMENNLDIASARYARLFSQTDVLRAKAGGAPRGSQAYSIPSGLFAGALGQGLGSTFAGVSRADTPAISGGARAVFISPRGGFDPAITFNLSVNHSNSPLNTLRVAGVTNSISHTAAFQARYAQALASGTTFTVAFNTLRQTSNQRNLRFNPAYTPDFSFTVTQELLSGFGFAVNRRFLTVANNGQQISREYFRQQVTAVVAQAQNSYWDLVAFREVVRSAEQALTVAQQLYEDNKKQAEVGTLAPLDVVAAESEVASRQRDLIIAQTNLQKAEIQLKTLISRRLDDTLAAAQIESTDPLPDPNDADVPKMDEALAAAQQNRPELRQAEGNIMNQQVAVDFSKDALKPSLNLFGQVSSSSLYGRQVIPGPDGAPAVVIPGGWGSAMTQLAHFDYPSYSVGVSLVIPIKNRSAQADNLRARLEQRQTETSLQRTRNQIALEVRNAVIGLMQTKAQVEAAQKTVEFERQTLDAERKKLAAGTSRPYNVILVQRDLLNAQLAAVQARAGYAKARVEMDRATGVLLEKNQIDPAAAPRGEFSK